MALTDNIVAFNPAARRVALDEKAQKVVADCRGVVERALPNLTNGLFEKLDDALYELADKSQTNQLQTSYFHAMRILRLNRPSVQSGFLTQVLADFELFWQQGPRPKPQEQSETATTEDALSLVEEAELEESLAVTNLVSKGESQFQRELYALNRRFGQLVGGIEVESDVNPLGPAVLCNHFYSVIRPLEVDTPVRLVIYKLFDRQVLSHLGGLYEEINSLLGRAGIVSRPVPRIRPGRSGPGLPPTQTGGSEPDPAGLAAHPRADVGMQERAIADPGVPSAYSAAAGYGASAPAPGTDELEAELFATLQGLLSAYRVRMGVSLPRQSADVPAVARRELIGALSALQHATPAYVRRGEEGRVRGMDLRGRLAEQLQLREDGQDRRALVDTDQDTLDVISLLFEFLLQDPTLPDAMKALIARLQIPMVKVAIMDRSFFSQKLHPARRLLNSLAHAAVGWCDDGDRSENSLYGRMESIVDRVVSEFGDDPGLFEELNEELAAFLAREQRGAEIAEQRTNQVTRGKEQLRMAKQLVGDEIAKRVGRYPRVPLVVRTLLQEGWKDVLLLTHLRQGPDSDTWKENLAITDQLLWSVAPKASYAERQELLRAMPDLLRSLREGLNGISYDQHRIARMFKELQACHISCLRGGGSGMPYSSDTRTAWEGPQAGDASAPVRPGAQRPAASVPAEPAASAPRDRHTESAEGLRVGTWLQLQEEEGQQSRVKLSWKSDVTDAYVFVNRKGVKVLEITLVGVAKLLRDGKAKILEGVDTPIMERALGAMLSTLKDSGPMAG